MNFLLDSAADSYFLQHDYSYSYLYVAPGDGSFATQSTVIWIYPSVNLYVTICEVCSVACGVVCDCTHPIIMAWSNLYF